MRSHLVVAVLFMGIVGCARLPAPDFSPAEPHIKVVTYNVNWGCPRPDRVVTFLAAGNADIVCLQETHPQWEVILRNGLDRQYPYFKFVNSSGAGGCAILSRFRLDNVRVLESKDHWFPALYAEADTPIGRIPILTVHLRPQVSDRGSVTPSAVYYSPSVHRTEMKGFLEVLGNYRPLLIMGDFNENESNGAVSELVAAGFVDALSLFDRRSATWNWTVASVIKVSDRFDHILFRPPLGCTGAAVRRVEASDHMPVVATLTRSETPLRPRAQTESGEGQGSGGPETRGR